MKKKFKISKNVCHDLRKYIDFNHKCVHTETAFHSHIIESCGIETSGCGQSIAVSNSRTPGVNTSVPAYLLARPLVPQVAGRCFYSVMQRLKHRCAGVRSVYTPLARSTAIETRSRAIRRRDDCSCKWAVCIKKRRPHARQDMHGQCKQS